MWNWRGVEAARDPLAEISSRPDPTDLRLSVETLAGQWERPADFGPTMRLSTSIEPVFSRRNSTSIAPLRWAIVKLGKPCGAAINHIKSGRELFRCKGPYRCFRKILGGSL